MTLHNALTLVGVQYNARIDLDPILAFFALYSCIRLFNYKYFREIKTFFYCILCAYAQLCVCVYCIV